MKVFCCFLKEVVFKNFSLGVNAFVSKKKRYMHIHLQFQYQSTNLFINLLNLFQMSEKNEKISFLTTSYLS